MKVSSLLSLIFAGGLLVGARTAEAACVDGTIAACNAGGTNICNWDPGAQMYQCQLRANGGAAGATATAITNGTTVEVFGTDSSGANFCCQQTLPAYGSHRVDIVGSDFDDTILFTYGSYDLDSVAIGVPMWGTVLGAEGDDLIDGSNSTNTDYSERLTGGEGNDDIIGNDGDDEIYGSRGDDVLGGNDGDDTIFGDAGDDEIDGGDGDDTIFGDSNVEWVESYNDTIDGGDDNDIICSGGNSTFSPDKEDLSGGRGDDIIWASYKTGGAYASIAATYADVDGGRNTDDCDGGATTSSCENTLTSEPSVCWP